MHMALKSNGVNHTPQISGRGLRRRRLTRSQRVGLAADLASGRLQLEPSLNQVCALVNVAPAQVREELKARAANQTTASLVTAWYVASDAEREEAIRTIGVAEVWDALARVVA